MGALRAPDSLAQEQTVKGDGRLVLLVYVAFGPLILLIAIFGPLLALSLNPLAPAGPGRSSLP
jgi:hypothetical protein